MILKTSMTLNRLLLEFEGEIGNDKGITRGEGFLLTLNHSEFQ